MTGRTLLACLFVLLPLAADSRKFYPDDPLHAEPPPRDASEAIRRKISDYYDFFQETFSQPGQHHPKKGSPIPAQAVNTLGEPMNGPWYEHRHYFHPMTIEQLRRGPGDTSGPSMDGAWKVIKAKSEGITPGFEFIDVKGRRYVLKFDPLQNPEIATAPDVLVSKFFHALGYHVPENYIVFFTREQLELGEDVELVDKKGVARKMTERDVTELLMDVPKRDGKYRGGASLYLSGKPLGPFKYHGMRRDDPNDIVPHEHRRDLRGLSVFCAWLGHDDSRAINSQDMLVSSGATAYIKHHLIDFGSTLGSASNGPNTPRSGFEYIFAWRPAIKQFFTFGLLVPRWATAHYPDDTAVGRFEGDVFDAEGWVPEYPNPAFSNRLPDDGFWAAKQVMAFTDEQIRAIVQTGQYSRKSSENWIADSLIKRRDKIGRAFFARLLPLDRFSVQSGQLLFQDLGVVHGFRQAVQYQAQWSVFNNDSGQKSRLAGRTSFDVPSDAVPPGGYLAAEIRAQDPEKTVTVYLRRGADSFEVVGIDRAW